MSGALKEAYVRNCIRGAKIHVVDEGEGVFRTNDIFKDGRNLVILGLCSNIYWNLNEGGLSVVRNTGDLVVRCNLNCIDIG
jgi:hypothetical protein